LAVRPILLLAAVLMVASAADARALRRAFKD
jgi:hypothetical protein